MILCSICFKKIDKELHEVAERVEMGITIIFKCPSCRQEITNLTAIPMVSFPDCVSKVRYTGLNSWEDARSILKMMQ